MLLQFPSGNSSTVFLVECAPYVEVWQWGCGPCVHGTAAGWFSCAHALFLSWSSLWQWSYRDPEGLLGQQWLWTLRVQPTMVKGTELAQ